MAEEPAELSELGGEAGEGMLTVDETDAKPDRRGRFLLFGRWFLFSRWHYLMYCICLGEIP